MKIWRIKTVIAAALWGFLLGLLPPISIPLPEDAVALALAALDTLCR